MLKIQDLALKNNWWADEGYRTEEAGWIKRDLYDVVKENLDHSLILNIVGLRRAGKSTLIKQIISALLEQKVDPKNIFYYLFDYASQLQKAEFLDEVLSVYFNDILNKPNLLLDEKIYIFLDEIQYIKDWQAVLKKYYDLSGKKIKFIVTGSQSVLLKGKHQESLAGRVFDFYLSPMSFREFLKINQEKVDVIENFDLFELPQEFGKLSIYNSHFGSAIATLSREYITVGQFPEARQLKDVEKKQEYITESVIGKILEDCIRIFDIEKRDGFKLVAQQMINNAGSIFELKNIGREAGISFVTLNKYIDYLKESYVIEVLYKYHKSLIRRGRILKKVYTPCVNFICTLNRYDSRYFDEAPQIFGKIIENAVYNVLKRKYLNNEMSNTLSFWRQGEKEIDFIIIGKNKKIPIEVKFSNNLNLKKMSTLTDYMKKNKLSYGIIVTKNEMSKKNIDGKIVYCIPYHLILLMI